MASTFAAPVRRLAVFGAGQMGQGIAYVSAVKARCTSVILVDSQPIQLERSRKYLETLVQKDLNKGRIDKDIAEAARSAWSFTDGVDGLTREVSRGGNSSVGGNGTFDMVIEAAREKLAVKLSIMAELAKAFPDEQTILATNTSSLSITRLAASAVQEGESTSDSKSAGRVVGMHWMNPVPVLPLVEIIPALQTTESTLQRTRAFAQACGKTLVTSKDTPGFIANRLLMPYINEAIMCYEEGVATKEDIDLTMHLAMSHPMGPLRLADFIGLDTCHAIMMTLYRDTADSKYRPAVLLGRMVNAGWLGKKAGKGFYDY